MSPTEWPASSLAWVGPIEPPRADERPIDVCDQHQLIQDGTPSSASQAPRSSNCSTVHGLCVIHRTCLASHDGPQTRSHQHLRRSPSADRSRCPLAEAHSVSAAVLDDVVGLVARRCGYRAFSLFTRILTSPVAERSRRQAQVTSVHRFRWLDAHRKPARALPDRSRASWIDRRRSTAITIQSCGII